MIDFAAVSSKSFAQTFGTIGSPASSATLGTSRRSKRRVGVSPIQNHVLYRSHDDEDTVRKRAKLNLIRMGRSDVCGEGGCT